MDLIERMRGRRQRRRVAGRPARLFPMVTDVHTGWEVVLIPTRDGYQAYRLEGNSPLGPFQAVPIQEGDADRWT